MADDRIRELLRELRERWNVDLVLRPPHQLLEELRGEARSALYYGGSWIGALLVLWLRAIGAPAVCGVARPQPSHEHGGRRYRHRSCTRELGHEGDHERKTAKLSLTWPQSDDDLALREYLAEAEAALAAGNVVRPSRGLRRRRRRSTVTVYQHE